MGAMRIQPWDPTRKEMCDHRKTQAVILTKQGHVGYTKVILKECPATWDKVSSVCPCSLFLPWWVSGPWGGLGIHLASMCRGQGHLSWVRVRTALWFWGMAWNRKWPFCPFLFGVLVCHPSSCSSLSRVCGNFLLCFLLNIFSMNDSSHSSVLIIHSCIFFMVSKELTCSLHTKIFKSSQTFYLND